MSCPKCGSGAVFQGKCRECGTVVDPRRASSSSGVRGPGLGDDDDGEGDTILDKKKNRPAPDVTRGSPRRASRSAMGSEAAPADQAPEAPLAPGKPWRSPERSNWYAAAGMKTPSERFNLSEASGQSTAHNEMPGAGPPVVLLVALAAVQILSMALGQSLIGGIGAAIAAVAALLLWRGAGTGKAAAWLFALWSVAWAVVQAVLFKQPLLGVLQALPAVCLLGALHAGVASVRWIAAVIGVALCLAGLAPQVSARQGVAKTEDVPVESGSFSDARLGYSLKVPDGVGLFAAARAGKEYLPSGWAAAIAPRLVFATQDRSFVGGLVVTQQPPGMDLSNMLGSLNLASEPTLRNDKLAPDSLRDFDGEGWEFNSPQGTVLVVLCRSPDGRAFALFGVGGPAARVRNVQLFSSIAWGLQVRKLP